MTWESGRGRTGKTEKNALGEKKKKKSFSSVLFMSVTHTTHTGIKTVVRRWYDVKRTLCCKCDDPFKNPFALLPEWEPLQCCVIRSLYTLTLPVGWYGERAGKQLLIYTSDSYRAALSFIWSHVSDECSSLSVLFFFCLFFFFSTHSFGKHNINIPLWSPAS